MDPSRDLAAETLDNLVRQFSQELCFYRELIQNALDAHTNRVDVRLEFLPGEEEQGTAVIHVDDYGEGMNRRIIDTQLTRLFSSTKEGDYTKIGKFGIGFVSVFALFPQAVIVDTSRDGENWRVVFHENREFDRIARPDPVDGTRIRILKEMTRSEFENLVRRSREVVRYWCRHSGADIFFQGERINEPLDVEAPVKVHQEEEGSRVVAGASREERPFFGLYNGGITLLEGRHPFVPGVTFKLLSRYLEHTLTRDNVIRDSRFEKALELVRRLAEGPVTEALLEAVREAASQVAGRAAEGSWNDHPSWNRLEELAPHVSFRLPRVGPGSGAHRRPLFPTVDGRVLSVREVRSSVRALRALPRVSRREDLPSVVWDDRASPGAAILSGRGVPVFCGRPGSPVLGMLEEAARGPARRLFEAILPWESAPEDPRREALGEKVADLLTRAGASVKGVRWIRRRGEETGGQGLRPDPPWLPVPESDPLILTDDVPDAACLEGGFLGFLPSHPKVEALVRLGSREPDLAAYLLAKTVLRRDGMDLLRDEALVEGVLAARRRSS